MGNASTAPPSSCSGTLELRIGALQAQLDQVQQPKTETVQQPPQPDASPPAQYILRLAVKQRVKKADVETVISSHATQANLADNYVIKGQEWAKAFTMVFDNTCPGGTPTATDRAAQFLTSLRNSDGTWIDLSITPPHANATPCRLYVNKNKTQSQLRVAWAQRAFKRVLAILVPNITFAYSGGLVAHLHFAPICELDSDPQRNVHRIAWWDDLPVAITPEIRTNMEAELAKELTKGPSRG